MLTTSLSLLKSNHACTSGYDTLVKRLGKDFNIHTPIPIVSGLDHHSITDVLWCLRAVDEDQQEQRDKLSRLIACDIAELVLPVFEDKYPDDNSPRNAIDVARKYANGQATKDELNASAAAAFSVASYAAGDPSAYTSYAAYSASVSDGDPSAYAASASAAAYTSYAAFSASAYYAAYSYASFIKNYDEEVKDIIRKHLTHTE